MDGLTNSAIRFDELTIQHGESTVAFTFGIYTDNDTKICDYEVVLENRGVGVSQMIAEAHHAMTDVVRQWLYWVDKMGQAYEKPAQSESTRPH